MHNIELNLSETDLMLQLKISHELTDIIVINKFYNLVISVMIFLNLFEHLHP
jgi:hypothetical protein